MKTLVTGGLGYIGSRLVERLLALGESVNVFDLQCPRRSEVAIKQVEYFSGNMLDAAAVERAMKGCTHVFHLAGYARNWAPVDETFFEVNAHGTDIVLSAALRLGIRRVVHTSSNLTIGPSNGHLADEQTRRKNDFYTLYERSKFESEQIALAYNRKGLDVVIVNPARVFGPGPLNESNAVTKMMKLYLEGTWRVILGDGKAEGNYVFIEDLINGYILARRHGVSGKRYILGGENISFNRFFATLAAVSCTRRWLIHLPQTLALAFAKVEQFLANTFGIWPLITPEWTKTFLHNWAQTSSSAEHDLGYTITPFTDAIQQTVRWIRTSSTSQTSNGKRGLVEPRLQIEARRR